MVRTVLAALLLDANSVVSTDRLGEVLWGQRPPTTAMQSLRNHVMGLRRELGREGRARIRSVPPGYLVEVGPGELDAQEFDDTRARGLRAVQERRWEDAARDLTAALALWRGGAFCDAPGIDPLDPRIQELEENRLLALDGRIEADLELGRHREVVNELRSLAVRHPLRESFHGQLMLALYRCGRQAEALDAYRSLRRVLVHGLGVEPSEPTRRVHERILSADPALAAEAPRSSIAGSVVRLPWVSQDGRRNMLPADTRAFTGRASELDRLQALAQAAHDGGESGTGAPVICAIDGMAGIGKTALAVHAAHRVRKQFPDGQLFLDLHGYTHDLEPLTGGDALDGLLRCLGVPPQLIPKDLQERAAFYRDRLAGTRTLIVLDNVASTAQVRPLLPANSRCLLLVTSRRRLIGLDDAHSLPLDVLSGNEAVALLDLVAGPGRVPEDHPAAPELIELCGRMPLAIRIIAARLRYRGTLRLEDLVASLRDENARLDHLRDEDRSLTAVFDVSYAALPDVEQRVFRRLGLIPGPDLDAFAAANLAAIDRGEADRLLDSLLGHNLVIQHTPGRYRLHDLVRVHARALCDEDPAEERDAALERLLDYYRHTAHAADRLLARQNRSGGVSAALERRAAVPALPDRACALAWMRAEWTNVLAAFHAAAQTRPAHAVALAAGLSAFLHLEGPWFQAADLHFAAGAIAREHGDLLGEANALDNLGLVRRVTEDYAGGVEMHQRAAVIYRELGDRLGEANALWGVGQLRFGTGDDSAADELYGQALAIYREVGDRLGEANSLWALGCMRGILNGRFDDAAVLISQALAIYRELDSETGTANALRDLGYMRTRTGDYPGAAVLIEQAIEIFQRIDYRRGEAGALWELGRIRYVTGQYAAAAELHSRALASARELGHRQGEAHCLWDLGRVLHATGDYAAAIDLHERALRIFQGSGILAGAANALHGLGRACHATGDHKAAADLYDRALAVFREGGDPQGQAEVLTSMGELRAETAGPQEALALFRVAADFAGKVSSPLYEARALEGAARCRVRLADQQTALVELRRAVEIYRRVGAAEARPAAARLVGLENRQPVGNSPRPSF